jgi:hypothetical protein
MKFFFLYLVFLIPIYSQVTTKIFPQDGGDYHRFGYNLSIDSTFFAISAQNGSLGAGAVYIYKLSNNKIQYMQKILPDTSYFGYNFGSPVLMKDSLLFIGANKKVLIYQLNNDSIFQKIEALVPFDPMQTEQYGRAISEHNKTLFIGAYADGLEDKGAAYYYDYLDTGWVFKQKIYPGIAERRAHFGSRLAHSDKYAIISAPGDGYQSGPMRGSAFLYEKTDSGWIETQKILPTDSTYYQLFGIDLALDNNNITIGAVGHPTLNQWHYGRIYIYEISEDGIAELRDSIFASDNYPGNNFGWSFRLRRDSLFIGAFGTSYLAANPQNQGQDTWAYLFNKTENGWEEKLKFEPTIQDPESVFGWAVDFLNGNFLVGAPGDPFQGFKSGVAYLFQPNITSIIEEEFITDNYNLYQNYPNPFNPVTKIKFSVPKSDIVQIKVYDILGSEIKLLLNEYKQHGTYEAEFDASNLPSGVYFYRMISGSYAETKKMILLR